MKNLDITIVAPQGSGKTQLAQGIFKVMDITPERIVNMEICTAPVTDAIVDVLRAAAADAVVFDVPLEANLIAVADAVELYRRYTRRPVCAIYCIQSKQPDFLNYKHIPTL